MHHHGANVVQSEFASNVYRPIGLGRRDCGQHQSFSRCHGLQQYVEQRDGVLEAGAGVNTVNTVNTVNGRLNNNDTATNVQIQLLNASGVAVELIAGCRL